MTERCKAHTRVSHWRQPYRLAICSRQGQDQAPASVTAAIIPQTRIVHRETGCAGVVASL